MYITSTVIPQVLVTSLWWPRYWRAFSALLWSRHSYQVFRTRKGYSFYYNVLSVNQTHYQKQVFYA